MVNTSRRRRITEAVRAAGSLAVAELAELTGVSEMTVRRDLDVLAEQGVLERSRGGARSRLLHGERPPFAVRMKEGLEAKRRMAALVSELIADGESVVLGSGTTCLEVARALRGRRLVVTPLSLQALSVLAESSGPTQLLIPGGQPRPGEGAFTGPLTLASLRALRFDIAVLGCGALSAAQGLTTDDLDDAAVKQAAIASSRRSIAVVESAKLSGRALAFIAPVAAMNCIVTDDSAPNDEFQPIVDSGVNVRMA
jgi:DeoR/GlpR family transcriptional regulator of sugar metabolism